MGGAFSAPGVNPDLNWGRSSLPGCAWGPREQAPPALTLSASPSPVQAGGPPVPPCRPSLALGFLHSPWLSFALRWGQPNVHLSRGRWHRSPRRSVAHAGGAGEQSCRCAGGRAGVGGGCARRGPGGGHVRVGHPEQHEKGHPGPHCAISPEGTSHKLRPEPKGLQRGKGRRTEGGEAPAARGIPKFQLCTNTTRTIK